MSTTASVVYICVKDLVRKWLDLLCVLVAILERRGPRFDMEFGNTICCEMQKHSLGMSHFSRNQILVRTLKNREFTGDCRPGRLTIRIYNAGEKHWHILFARSIPCSCYTGGQVWTKETPS